MQLNSTIKSTFLIFTITILSTFLQAQSTDDSHAFNNMTWKFTHLLGESFENGSMRFSESRMSVSLECNYIGGYTFDIDSDTKAFNLGGSGRMTGKGCFGEDTSMEKKLAETIDAVTQYKLSGDTLSLLDSSGKTLMQMKR